MDDDFDLDNFDIDGGSDGFDPDDFDNLDSSDDGLEELNNSAGGNNRDSSIRDAINNSQSPKKTALVVIACGVIIIALVFGIFAIINKISSKEDAVPEIEYPGSEVPTVESTENTQVAEPIQQTTPATVTDTPPVSSNSVVDLNSGWIEFGALDDVITFNDELTETTFTVTGKKYYVRAFGDSNLVMRTVISGILSGFNGTYEIDVPISIAYNGINIGDVLNVKVHWGSKSDGKIVVDNIVYP